MHTFFGASVFNAEWASELDLNLEKDPLSGVGVDLLQGSFGLSAVVCIIREMQQPKGSEFRGIGI